MTIRAHNPKTVIMDSSIKKSLLILLIIAISICRNAQAQDYPKSYYKLNSDGLTLVKWIGKSPTMQMPDVINMNDDKVLKHIEIIGKSAFSGRNNRVKGLTIQFSNSVKRIDDMAFRNRLIDGDFILPNSVTHIGNGAFALTRGLVSLVIPESVSYIGESAFAGSAIKDITIPNSVTSIGSAAFNGTYLKSVTILKTNPSELELGSDIFSITNLSEATLIVPSGTIELYKNADQWKRFGTIKEN